MTQRKVAEPFPGLRPFEEEDCQFFFGRESQITELISRLGRHRFVAVLGESGSGKSSLVRAGLIPRLKYGLLPSSAEKWCVLTFEPGQKPLRELATMLSSLYANKNASRLQL